MFCEEMSVLLTNVLEWTTVPLHVSLSMRADVNVSSAVPRPDDRVAALLYKVRLSGGTGQPDYKTQIGTMRLSTGDARINAIAALGTSGDVVVCGTLQGVFLDPSHGGNSTTAAGAFGGEDIFVSRYSDQLEEMWTVVVRSSEFRHHTTASTHSLLWIGMRERSTGSCGCGWWYSSLYLNRVTYLAMFWF